MKSLHFIAKLFVIVSFFIFPYTSNAENIAKFDDYVIHYNALPTDILLPDVARAYKIKRSKNRGMVNIVVQHKGKGTTASVSGTGTNLNAQLKHLTFREVKDGDVTYYISDFRVTHKESIHFKINVQPQDSKQSHTIEFKKEFFTN